MGKLSSTGKVFFWVGVLFGITAAIHLSRGNYGVGSFMVFIAAAEFGLAYTTSKQAKG